MREREMERLYAEASEFSQSVLSRYPRKKWLEVLEYLQEQFEFFVGFEREVRDRPRCQVRAGKGWIEGIEGIGGRRVECECRNQVSHA